MSAYKRYLVFFLIILYLIPVIYADDGGCDSWELSRAGGYERGIDLSGRDFLTSGISTVESDSEFLQGNTRRNYKDLLAEHTTFIMAEHLEKTQSGYKDNVITVQAVGVATDGYDIWGTGGIGSGVQGSYLNLPFKGSVFETFHIPRSQYGVTKTREGSDGKTVRYCDYESVNEDKRRLTQGLVDEYTHSTMKGVFLASLNRVANVFTFMSTEQVPLSDILMTSDGTNYTLTGSSQTSSLIYNYEASVFPFSDGLVEDLSVFESEGWEDAATKMFMKKEYFFTGLSSLSADDVKAYEGSVGEEKQNIFQRILGSVNSSNTSASYLEDYNKVVSEYRVTVGPSDFYRGFIDGTSSFGKYIRFIDNTSVPADRRSGGITEFNYMVNGVNYYAIPTDWVSFILPLYVPSHYGLVEGTKDTYSLKGISPLEDYYISLLDLKVLKRKGDTFDLVGTITSYGDIGLGDLYLYNDGKQGVVLLSKFQEGIFLDGTLSTTGRALKLRGEYTTNLKLRDGNIGKFDYLNVENQSDGVESLFFAFSNSQQGIDGVHSLVESGQDFKFNFEPNFVAGEGSGVVMVRNNAALRVSSLTNYLKGTDKRVLLQQIATKAPVYSTDVEYEKHTKFEEMREYLKLRRVQEVESKLGSVFIFFGMMLIFYNIFFIMAYVVDMVADIGLVRRITFNSYYYADKGMEAFITPLKGDCKPLYRGNFIVRVVVIFFMSVFLINAYTIVPGYLFPLLEKIKLFIK